MNNSTAINQLEKEERVAKENVINILNYINFDNGTILVNFKHSRYDNVIALKVKPLPCLGDDLDCLWCEPLDDNQDINSYNFLNLQIADEERMIVVGADLKRLKSEGISFKLTDNSYQVISRKKRRYLCECIEVKLFQNGVFFVGTLLDFNAQSLRVNLDAKPPQSFHWINTEFPVMVTIGDDLFLYYTGECTIIRNTNGQDRRTLVLKPINSHIPRFKPKKYRSPRVKLVPSPNVIFKHPFTNTSVTLDVYDWSGCGFSVEEDEGASLLLPGMIIPEVEIAFPNNYKIRCKVQVVHRENLNDSLIKSGIAILDMDIEDHGRLSALLHRADNKNSYVCSEVDIDALMKFFFETGFVYPKKYINIEGNKEKLKETYEKLYTKSPNIARHFIYQERGVIHGHMSMIRFYENAWLIHHHAANKDGETKAGLVVLEQIGRYLNEAYTLYSLHMNFVVCYFRPENRFPNRVFGGVTKTLDDPKRCSIDPFAYFHYVKRNDDGVLPEQWTLSKSSDRDLTQLENYYEHESGGLLLNALDLDPGMIEHDDLNKAFHSQGFKRGRYLFSLKKTGDLKAIFMVNISDAGLNMSELTNCIHVLILSEDDLEREELFLSLSQLSHNYESDDIPILLYPVRYAEKMAINYDKTYNLWVLNMQYFDSYLGFIEKLLRRSKRKISNGITVLPSGDK